MIKQLRQRIGFKIILGYLAAVVMMIVFGVLAISLQQQIGATVTELTEKMEVEKSLLKDIVNELALTGLYANKYVKEPIQNNLDSFDEHFSEVESLLAHANDMVHDPTRREKLDQVRPGVRQYGAVFNEIAQLTQENQRIQAQDFNTQEIIIDNKMTALRIFINSLNDPNSFLIFSNGQTAYQNMRLSVAKYLDTGDERYPVLIARNYSDTKSALNELKKGLYRSDQTLNISDALTTLDAYYASFLVIQKNQSRMRALFVDELNVIEPQISSIVSTIASETVAEFELRNQASQIQVEQMGVYLMGATIILTLFSLIFGIFFSINLTRPLRQVMVASQQIANTDLALLSQQMSTISQGDTRLHLEITTTPLQVTLDDEVGQMAHAFNEIIFRLLDTRVAFEQMAVYLTEMTDAARDVADGNLNTQVTVHSDQDVLAKALINMVNNLRVTQNQLLMQLSRLDTLHQVDYMITTSRDLNATLTFLLEQAIQHLGIHAGQILTVVPRSNDLKSILHIGFPEGYNFEEHLKVTAPYGRQAIQDKKTILSHELVYKDCAEGPYCTSFFVPLLIQGEARGVMQAFCKSELDPDLDWNYFLETLAGQAAIAIDHFELVRGLEERVEQRTDELNRSKRFFESLVEHSPVAIVVLDLKNRISSWNPAAETLFGYTPDETIGKPLMEIVTPAGFEEETEELNRRAQTEFIHRLSHRKRKDKTQVSVEILGGPILVEGKLESTLIIYHDITDLEKARQAAEESTRAKSEFLANMSHEIRTPMNGVMGMTSLLLDTSLTSLQRDFVETIRISAESLLSIVNDILDFSKIEAGRMELEAQPFNLRDCIEGALDLVAHQAASKQIELAYLMSPRVPENVCGDETRLRQILVNLLSNSVKFTEKGEVVVNIQLDENAGPTRGPGNECHLLFSVHDTGIGIPPNRLDRLFQSFSQVDASTTRKYGGTGLGLTISKRLTEMMAGKIWVKSEGIPGKGSTFYFTIQLTEAPQQPQYDPEAILDSMKHKKVYIVDDNPTNREILIHMTRKWDMDPLAFASGKELLAEMDRGGVADVAILDVQMPEMDGITLSKEIRKRRTALQLPLMFLTSVGHKELTPVGIEPSAYLHKPIKSSQLYDAMVTVFSERPVHIEPLPSGTLFDHHLAERHPLRILLAEDHVVNQKVALLTLEKLGYRADLASNGIEVLQAFERQDYDVVLMDAQMPEMDGVEATRQLRANLPEQRQPWIIALTANVLISDQQQYLAVGMDDYLRKPMHIEHLVKALEKCTAGGRSASQLSSPAGIQLNRQEPSQPLAEQNLFQPVFTATGDEDVFVLPIDLTIFNEHFPDFEQDLENIVPIVHLFLEDTPLQLQNLHKAIANQDFETLRIVAHSLKGASLTFGAVTFSALAKNLETIARSGGALEDALKVLEQIEDEYPRVEYSLKDLIGE